MKLYSPDITKPTEVNYYWHEKVLVEPMPKPKQGEWIDDDFVGQYRCSECDYYAIDEYDYCPNCGAKMKGADDDL